jgi:hypothetical protein
MTTDGDKKRPFDPEKDCIVKVNCIQVRGVPVGLRSDIHPVHKALLEVIEELGADGEANIGDVLKELNRRMKEGK